MENVNVETVETEVLDTGANEVETAEQPQEHHEQTLEERAGFAAARRRAEAQYKLQIDTQKSRMDNFAKMHGYETWDEMEQETSKQQLSDAGLTAEALLPLLNRAVEEHPLIKAAQEMTVQSSVDKSFDEFKAQYPDSGINSIDDFAKMDNYDKFYQYVCNGLDFSDAYTLANKDVILQKKTAAAKQAAINSVNSKEHLKSTTGDGSIDEVTVPSDVYENYKKMLPNWTDKQIRAHYAKAQKG